MDDGRWTTDDEQSFLVGGPWSVVRRLPSLVGLGGLQDLDGALPAVDADAVAGAEAGSGVDAADDGRDAQLTGDDGGVGEGRSHVGDDGGGTREEGRPANVRHGSDQDLTGLELSAILKVVQAAD